MLDLLDRVSTQTLAPSRIVFLPHRDAEASVGQFLPHAEHVEVAEGYSGSAARAVFDAARGNAAADFIAVLDLSEAAMLSDRRYLEAMVHAAGTTEFGAALLATSGVVFVGPRGRASARSICRPERSTELHLPTGPYLLQGSWLSSSALVSGLRSDLPHGPALALALRRKAGLHAYALPVVPSEAQSTRCTPLELPKDRDVLKSIADEYAVEPLVDTDQSAFASSADFLAGAGAERVAIVAASAADLRRLSGLACSIASHASGGVEVVTFGIDVGRSPLNCLLDVKRIPKLAPEPQQL